MRVAVVSLFPDMVRAAAGYGVLGRALESGVLSLDLVNPRDFTTDRHRTVDDRPYGGGPGMVMLAEPLLAAIAAAREAVRAGGLTEDLTEDMARDMAGEMAGVRPHVVYLSPQGARLDQRRVRELATLPGLVMIAGRYEGVDERVIETAVDEELSIGDYVLTGGELPALVVLDAVARQLPGTLGNWASAMEESHLDGLLDYPHYTRPESGAAGVVPPVLMTGDHRAIGRWRRQQALLRTWQRRPEMLNGRRWTAEDRLLLAECLDRPEPDTSGEA